MADKPNVDSNSIHDSYNKCIGVQATSNLTISNNVCARAVGHLFYQETDTEGNTAFIGNLGIGAMSHHFDIDTAAVPRTTDGLIKNWWEGDNLAKSMATTASASPTPTIN